MNDQSLGVDAIVDAFARGDATHRRAVIERCPPTPMTGVALTFATMESPGMYLQAVNCLATAYSASGPHAYTVLFGEAGYRLGRDAYEAGERTGASVLVAGGAAIGWLTGLQQLGEHRTVQSIAPDVVAWLRAVGDTSNIYGVEIKRVETELELENYDAAERLLDAIPMAALAPAQQVSYSLLRERLDRRKGPPTDLRPAETVSLSEAPRFAEQARRLLDGMFGGSSGDNARAAHQRVVDAAMLFADARRGHDPIEINARVPQLERDAAWAHDHQLADIENDARWTLQICYGRTGRGDDAIDQLQRLRRNIEAARSRIVDPLMRARIVARWPQLFAMLCFRLYEARRERELVEAIEASKGRALADVLALNGQIVAPDEAFGAAIEDLPALLGRERATYLTYFVDDADTFAALVGADGVIGTHCIPLGRDILTAIATDVRRSAAAPAREGIASSREWRERLEPLAAPLAALDPKVPTHLCYAPDDALHQLPMHVVPLRGQPIARTYSMSRTHGAYVLAQLLRASPTTPTGAVSVEVPSASDALDPARVEVFSRCGSWFATQLDDHVRISETRADIDALAAIDLRRRIVHFATHGVFPVDSDDRAANPFHASGLLLATRGRLPELTGDQVTRADHLLSPEALLARQLSFEGAHVTLQACVSGLARDGIGGDALGLEWSLFQLGASSILSTLWNVGAHASTAFAIRFYEHWQSARRSRAEAWHAAVLQLLDDRDVAANPLQWGAFALSGDWR